MRASVDPEAPDGLGTFRHSLLTENVLSVPLNGGWFIVFCLFFFLLTSGGLITLLQVFDVPVLPLTQTHYGENWFLSFLLTDLFGGRQATLWYFNSLRSLIHPVLMLLTL